MRNSASGPNNPLPGSEFGLFFQQSLRSFSVTASLCPSSKSLAGALLRSVDFDSSTVIVELGSGTGAVTSEILRRMSPDCRLYALDINPAFVSYLRRKIQDPRLVPILGPAEHLGSILRREGVRSADAIVSSLGLSTMPHELRCAIVRQLRAHLNKRGVLTQFQYVHAHGSPRWLSNLGVFRFAEEEFLRQHFGGVRTERVFRNFPPATVFTCRP
jgi:phospholipid N-methyltransferase